MQPSSVIRFTRAHVRAWGPATLWLAVLFILSHQPNDTVPTWWSVPDAVAHVALYAVLGAALAWGRHITGRPGWPPLGAFGIAWAISDEWHQSFVPGRDPSAGDVLADVVGLLIGGTVAAFTLRSDSSARSNGMANSIDAAS